MNVILMVMLACGEAAELPPKVHIPTPTNSRMVQMNSFRGFLQRPAEANSSEAILKIVETITAAERESAKGFSQQTVLIIERDQNVQAATAYLNGLADITSVRTMCTVQQCP